MAFGVSPDLAAAQRAPVRRYDIECHVGDVLCERPRLDWTQLYGISNRDHQHAMVAIQGAVYRIAVWDTGQTQLARLIYPDSSAAWSTWQTDLGIVATNMSPVAAGAYYSNLTALTPYVFYLRRSDAAIVCRRYVGGAWSAEQLVYAPPVGQQIMGLAATAADDHTLPNLCTNPSFEADFAGWSAWLAPTTAERVALNPQAGSYSLHVVNTGYNGGKNFTLTGVAGRTFTVSVYAKKVTGKPKALQLASDGTPAVSTTIEATSTDMTRYHATVTCPANATFLRLYLGGGYTTTDTHEAYYDAVQIEAGATLTPYHEGSTAHLIATLLNTATGEGDPIAIPYHGDTDTWGAPINMSWGFTEIRDVAAVRDPEANQVHVWFTAQTGLSWSLYYNRLDAGAWTAATIIALADNGQTYNYPSALYDPTTRRYFLTWRQLEPTFETAQAHLVVTPRPDQVTERVPLPRTATYQHQLVHINGTLCLSAARNVYTSPCHLAPGAPEVDVSARVAALDEDYSAPNKPARLTLRLDNHDGALADAGQEDSPYRPIRPGSQVSLRVGCNHQAGSWRSPWYIDDVVYEQTERGEAYLRLDCVDPTGLLHGLKSRDNVSLTGTTALEAAWRVLYRVTGEPLNNAGGLTATLGWFSILVGADWGQTIEHLMEWAGCVLRWSTNPDATIVNGLGLGAAVPNAIGLAEGASVRHYQPNGHPYTLATSHLARQLPYNAVRVMGAEAEPGDWTTNSATADDLANQLMDGRVALRSIVDRKCTYEGDALSIATQALRWAQIERERHELQVYPDLGVQIGDVVTYSHPRAGIDARLCRVISSRLVIDTRKGTATHKLTLAPSLT